jgi:hypothetical protein
VIPLRNNENETTLIIPRLTFPTTKDKMLQILKDDKVEYANEYAKDGVVKNGILSVIDAQINRIKHLPLPPDKEYKDAGELEEEITRLFNDESALKSLNKWFKLFGKPIRPGMIVGCKVFYEKDVFERIMNLTSDQRKKEGTKITR